MPKKVIFLDIDGVLSGREYQLSATEEPPLIDKSRLPIIKEIVDKSGAEIVLSSSWKTAWEKGCGFDLIFREAGIEIFDVTPRFGRKRNDITAWLNRHPDTEGYAIIDDADADWEHLLPHVVVTDHETKRGIEPEDIPLVLEKLAIV